MELYVNKAPPPVPRPGDFRLTSRPAPSHSMPHTGYWPHREVTRTSLRVAVGVTIGSTIAIGLWVLWMRLADMVAYRAPYGHWLCQIDAGGVMGDPLLTTMVVGQRFELLVVSFGVVALIALGTGLRGWRSWLCLVAAVVIISLVTWGYVAGIDSLIATHGRYEVPECP